MTNNDSFYVEYFLREWKAILKKAKSFFIKLVSTFLVIMWWNTHFIKTHYRGKNCTKEFEKLNGEHSQATKENFINKNKKLVITIPYRMPLCNRRLHWTELLLMSFLCGWKAKKLYILSTIQKKRVLCGIGQLSCHCWILILYYHIALWILNFYFNRRALPW